MAETMSLLSPYKKEPYRYLSDAASKANSRLHDKLQQKPTAVSPKKISRLQYGSSKFLKQGRSPTGSPENLSKSKEFPSPEETAELINYQEDYIRQLETEIAFAKEEIHQHQTQLMNVLADNGSLNDDRAQTVTNIMRIVCSPTTSPEKKVLFAGVDETDRSGKEEIDKWRKELDQIVALHKSKSDRLETELRQARGDLSRLDETNQTLQDQLRRHQVASCEGSAYPLPLCTQCLRADPDMVNKYYTEEQHAALAEEKSQLMSDLLACQERAAALSQREQEACAQLNTAMTLAEEAEAEKGQILLQKQQLQGTVDSQQRKLEAQVIEYQKQVAEHKEAATKLASVQLQGLESKLKVCQEGEFLLKEELDKTLRDKENMETMLKKYKKLLEEQENGVTEDYHTMKRNLVQVTMERDALLDDRSRLKRSVHRLEGAKDEVVLRVKTELTEVRSRLDQAEQDLLATKEDCIRLTEQKQALEQELDKSKCCLSKQDKKRRAEVKESQERLYRRERELTTQLEQVEQKHSARAVEMENLLASQSSLLESFRAECHNRADAIANKTSKYKQEVKRLGGERQAVVQRYKRCKEQLHQSGAQQLQAAGIQDQLRKRVSHLDSVNREQAYQIKELIAKLSEVEKDRTLISKQLRVFSDNLPNSQRQDESHTVEVMMDILKDQDRSIRGGLSIIQRTTEEQMRVHRREDLPSS